MIEKHEVLHVARLARLELSDSEVQAMQGELSKVLDHVAKIGELDLQGVRPSTHVIADECPPTEALRPDEPRECLRREAVLAGAPAVSEAGFLVPSPQA